MTEGQFRISCSIGGTIAIHCLPCADRAKSDSSVNSLVGDRFTSLTQAEITALENTHQCPA